MGMLKFYICWECCFLVFDNRIKILIVDVSVGKIFDYFDWLGVRFLFEVLVLVFCIGFVVF